MIHPQAYPQDPAAQGRPSNAAVLEALQFRLATCLECVEPHFFLVCEQCGSPSVAIPEFMSWTVAWLWAGAHHRGHQQEAAAKIAREGRTSTT